MAEKSGFFDAHLVNGEYDRVYLAENFARYFASFIGNGIFGGKSNELMVQQKATADMSVRVLSGQGWINGYWYENDNELSLAIDVADGVLNRIDIIVLRWDNSERVIRLAVKKGTSATNPSVPVIQRGADFYELKLAQVYVKAGAIKITQADITDTRLNNEVCGFVHGVIDQFDTTEFGKQIDSFIENFEASSNAKIEEILADLRNLLEEEDVTYLGIEDVNHPGCFYRMRDNEKEWLNPPMEFGIEYRTVERYRDEVIYTKLIYAASLPNNSTMSIDTKVPAYNIVSIEGRVLDTNENIFHPIPFSLPNQTIPTCVISSVEYDGELLVYSSLDLSHCEGFFTLKYRKP